MRSPRGSAQHPTAGSAQRPPAAAGATEDDRALTVTVLTPTFNRCQELPRLYESLCLQTYTDFEWLIVDDGSSDGTDELVRGWAREAAFPIRYLQQPNSGKHVALNRGVEHAGGRYCAVIDSDDRYPRHALERMIHHWEAIPADQRDSFANVEGLCAFSDGAIVGSRFPADVFDSDGLEIRCKYGVRGDTKGMFRTDVLREFPFPEDLGRFVTEALVWNRIALRYRSRFVNEVLGYNKYLPGGLSSRPVRATIEASKASLQYYQELLASKRALGRAATIRAYANLIRHSLHQGAPAREQMQVVPSTLLWLLTGPLGIALYLRDRAAVRGERDPHAPARSSASDDPLPRS